MTIWMCECNAGGSCGKHQTIPFKLMLALHRRNDFYYLLKLDGAIRSIIYLMNCSVFHSFNALHFYIFPVLARQTQLIRTGFTSSILNDIRWICQESQQYSIFTAMPCRRNVFYAYVLFFLIYNRVSNVEYDICCTFFHFSILLFIILIVILVFIESLLFFKFYSYIFCTQ